MAKAVATDKIHCRDQAPTRRAAGRRLVKVKVRDYPGDGMTRNTVNVTNVE
jgi:hypothetical protein